MRPEFSRPERTVKSELLSLLMILLVLLGVASVFPYRAIGYKFHIVDLAPKTFASLVFLSEEEEAEAIQRARSAWQTSHISERGLGIDLSMESLPELETTSVIENPVVHLRPRAIGGSLGNVPIVLPSLASEAPDKVDVSPIANEKYFSDEDLMKLK